MVVFLMNYTQFDTNILFCNSLDKLVGQKNHGRNNPYTHFGVAAPTFWFSGPQGGHSPFFPINYLDRTGWMVAFHGERMI